MSNELLQQALDALEYHTEQTRPIQRTEAAIKMLREAIAQPEQPAMPIAFHKSASHIPPDYRDGWNNCHKAFLEYIARPAQPATAQRD